MNESIKLDESTKCLLAIAAGVPWQATQKEGVLTMETVVPCDVQFVAGRLIVFVANNQTYETNNPSR